MKFKIFFLYLCVIFALLDPDPDSESGYGTTAVIESGSGSETLLQRNRYGNYVTCRDQATVRCIKQER